MSPNEFLCRTCGATFDVPAAALKKYPGWTPSTCMKCRPSKGGSSTRRGQAKGTGSARGTGRGSPQELNLTVAEVLERYDAGPHEGIFTDGACTGNPGPGGWGAVLVSGDEAVDQRHGHHPDTTNNRMELTALIEAFGMLPQGTDTRIDIYTDSELCVRTVNEWAAGWKRNGWRRKAGPVKNLDLVKKLYALHEAHPKVQIRWIKAHNGSRWNEYADALATAFLRDVL